MTTYTPEVAAAIQEAFDAAVTHYRNGQFEAADELYRAILQLDPQHPNTNYNLGLLSVQFNRAQDAVAFFKTALMAAPQEEKFWLSYLEVLVSVGDRESAEQTLALSRKHGLQLHGPIVARIETATSAPKTATAPKRKPSRQPTSAELNAMNQAFAAKDFKKLERLGKAVAEACPDATGGWKALSLAYFNQGRADLALEPTRKIVALTPDDPQAHANLGFMYMQLRRLREAEACLTHAIARRPDVADTHVNLGNVRKDMNRGAEAETCYRRAIVLEPQHAEAYANLGVIKLDQAEFREAEALFLKAIELKPQSSSNYGGLASALTKLGKLEQAEAVVRRAIEVNPDNLRAYDLLLFLLNYTHTNKSREALELAQRYGAAVPTQTGARFTSWICESNPQRLKVGIVSGDFNNHPIAFFSESLLRYYNREQMEIIAYSSMPARKSDATTERLRPLFAAWNDIHLLSYEQLAQRIHADGIHVLLDFSGHTTDNRLPTFAMKPAPVQASWLGYFATTGLPEMDYFIGDPWLCPQEEERDFTEAVWRLPKTWLCFTPPQAEFPIAPLPALTNGYITFGCLNNLNKMNDAVVALWAEVLRQVPTAKLLLKAPQLHDAEMRAQTLARYAAHGIAADRLMLEGPTQRGPYLHAYAKVDICLDPFPYPGGTTSVESLWMGVPVLTLRGNRFLSHLGESIAHNAGLPEWIADDKAEYVEKAQRFASNLSALTALRNGMRTRMQESPLLDSPHFANDFERMLWEMWHIFESRNPNTLTPIQ